MNERTIHLRIKIKSLADEARTIRAEAKKVTGMEKWGLNHHRTTVVREHARYSLLAYGILMRVPYYAMERKCREHPDWNRVSTTAKRFGGDELSVSEWIAQAKAYTEKPVVQKQLAAAV